MNLPLYRAGCRHRHPLSVFHRQGRRGQDLALLCHRAADSPKLANACCWSAPIPPRTWMKCWKPDDQSPTPIAGAPGLDAMNIDPVAAAAAYRERLIGPMRGLLPEAALRSMEEQLSGSCTVEIAAFDEFSGLIGDPDAAKDYDHVVFDTAPTGHTLRLMSLAKAWDQFLDANTSGSSCLGPLAGLEKQRAIYEATVHTWPMLPPPR
jgi:hypothetical protein